MQVCKHCGHALVNGQKICDVCGEYVFPDDEAQLQPQNVSYQQETFQQGVLEPEDYLPKDDMSPAQFKAGLVGLFILCGAIVVGGTILAILFFAS